MIKSGAITEVKKYRRLKVSKKSTVSKMIGIPELSKYLDQKITIEEAKELISIRTRQYAKRQITWSRSKMASWIKIEPNNFQTWLKN